MSGWQLGTTNDAIRVVVSRIRVDLLLTTILNRVQKQPGFVYADVRLLERPRLELEVEVRPRANSRARCSGCGRKQPGYDTLPARRFEYVPLWGIAVFLVYAMRRVDCGECGVRVEAVPWGSGKRQLTDTYARFLARWAKRLSWKEVAEVFQTSWDQVYRAVELAVERGRARQPLHGIEAIGIDEIQWQRGHRYLTLVYQIDEGCRRLLWVGQERRVKTLLRFICSDMWRPYLKVIAKKAGHAAHVLDRFHIMANLNVAINEVRAEEVKALKAGGYEPILTRARACSWIAGARVRCVRGWSR